MDEPLQASIARLSRELCLDPCRTDLLIERIILQAVARDLAAARSDLSTVQRLGTARGLTPALSLAACGRYWALAERGLYVLFDPSVGASLAELTVQCLRRAREEADRFFGPSGCRMVVELAPDPSGALYHASYEAPGIGYFKIAPCSPSVYLQLIAHEIAHLYLMSGNRFLDEGIALLFQHRCLDGPLHLGSGVCFDPGAAETPNVPFSLRALLAYDGQHDTGFTGLTCSTDYKPPIQIYASAYKVAAYFLDQMQLAGLQALYASLRATGGCAAHPSVVAACLGEEVEAIDERVFARASFTLCLDTPADREPNHPAATPIWAELSPDALDTLIAQLRYAVPRVRFRSGAKAALARAIARRALDKRTNTLAADVAELRSLVHELRADAGLAERERTLLEGWLAIAETAAAPNAIVRIIGWEHSLALFRAALARFANDGEVLCAAAAVNLRGPVELGADRALAQVCLAKARRLRGWAVIADKLEHDSGTAAAAATGTEGQP